MAYFIQIKFIYQTLNINKQQTFKINMEVFVF